MATHCFTKTQTDIGSRSKAIDSEYPGWNCLNFLRVFYVAKLIFHYFMKFSKKRPCIKTSLIRFNYYQVAYKMAILKLAAILRRKVLQISLKGHSKFESS